METTTPTTREILLWRVIGDKKIRWKFVVDEEMVIVNEGPADRTPGGPGNPLMNIESRKDGKSPTQAYTDLLTERGYEFEVADTGQIIVTHMPKKEKDYASFFNLEVTCPDIPGWSNLREAYKDELTKLGGDKCPGCTKATLMRKYRALLEKIANS